MCFMDKKVMRTIAYVLIAVTFSVSLTGCGLVPSLNITDEQRELIAEYAAGKLIEYVKGHPGGLMILDDVDRSEVNPGLKKEEEEEVPTPSAPLPGMTEQPPAPEAAPPEPEPLVDAPDGEAIAGAPEGASAPPTKTLAEALGISGGEVTFDHYEVTSNYPDNSDELAFSMKAATGKELLVMHFGLSNPGDTDLTAHTDSTDFKVRLMLNGEKIRGDVTFLENDLMNYDGVITPGACVDTVFVFEVPKGESVDAMDLIVIENDTEQTYKIK